MHSLCKFLKFPILVFLPWVSSTSCQYYLVHLGKEQIVQIYSREEIDKIIEKEDREAELKEKLEFVKSVREFAIRELSLSPKGGYKYYVHLNRDEVGWNVSASYPLEFKSYTWWFPISGTVPYKGFFDLELARAEESKLKSLGLDTRLRVTGGYSTLGWFSDPIYSTQLQWTKPRIAGLVIHEMAHSTVYIQGESQFNESYANFVENLGLEIYYSKDEVDDYEYKMESKNQENRRKTLQLIKNTARDLDSIYKSNLSDEEKLQKKSEAIRDFQFQVLKQGLIEKKNEEKFLSKDWNNEDFIGILRYKSGDSYFRKLFRDVNGDFTEFHKRVQEYSLLSDDEKKSIME